VTFLQHIPGTNPIPERARHPRAKGVGVLGLHEGRTLLLAMNRCSKAFPVAGCDRSDEKIAACRSELPDVHYTHDYATMLARTDVDIVAIYTPDAQHGQHIVQAFEAGKHVLCTKPLVNSVADARAVLAAARRTGRKLLVGQSTRFFEPFLRQRAAFERGEIGAVELADAHYVHRMDWYYAKSPWVATDTDWVYLGLSHPLDLLRWYLGRIREVHALGFTSELGREHGVKGRDVYVVNVLAEDGRIGRALGHYGVHELPRARNCIELLLYGSRGTSLAQYHDMRYVHTSRDNTEVVEDHLYAGRHYYFNSEVHGMHYGEFANYAEHFAGALIEGAPHAPGLEEGLETFCLMEAVKRSAGSGMPIALAPLLREIGLEIGLENAT
jgi:predicted dehydrogenase